MGNPLPSLLMSFVNGPYVYVNLKGLRTPPDHGARGGHGGGLDGPLEGPLVMLRKTESSSPSKNELYAKSNFEYVCSDCIDADKISMQKCFYLA